MNFGAICYFFITTNPLFFYQFPQRPLPLFVLPSIICSLHLPIFFPSFALFLLSLLVLYPFSFVFCDYHFVEGAFILLNIAFDSNIKCLQYRDSWTIIMVQSYYLTLRATISPIMTPFPYPYLKERGLEYEKLILKTRSGKQLARQFFAWPFKRCLPTMRWSCY